MARNRETRYQQLEEQRWEDDPPRDGNHLMVDAINRMMEMMRH